MLVDCVLDLVNHDKFSFEFLLNVDVKDLTTLLLPIGLEN